MRKNKINKDESYDYSIQTSTCVIYKDGKQITQIKLPDVDKQDMEIRLREHIVVMYGIRPDRLCKIEKKK